MNRSFVLTIACIGALALSAPGRCAEPPSEEKLIAAIHSALALPGHRVVVRTNGKEILVSTYRSPEANLGDCKIDAALIGKALLVDNDFGLSRCRVHFHEPAGTSSVFQEVVVTLAEIKGYAAGSVTKEQFLDSIDVQKIEEVKPKVEAVKEDPAKENKEERAGSNDEVSGDEPAKTAEVVKSAEPPKDIAKPKPAEKFQMVSKRTGIKFSVPKGWLMKDSLHGATIFRLTSARTKDENVELEYRGGDGYSSAQQRAAATKGIFSYNGCTVERYFPTTHFGTGPYAGSMIVLRYPNHNEAGLPYYEMHLYFGDYMLRGWSDATTYSTVRPAFDEIVRSLTFPAPAATTATIKKAPVERK